MKLTLSHEQLDFVMNEARANSKSHVAIIRGLINDAIANHKTISHEDAKNDEHTTIN